MQYSIYAILAVLLAAPPGWAQRLQKDLVVTLATDWPDGTIEMVPGRLLDEAQFGGDQNLQRSRNIGDLEHNITIDDKEYRDIFALIFKDVAPQDAPDDNIEFKAWRTKWGDWQTTAKTVSALVRCIWETLMDSARSSWSRIHMLMLYML
jgi:hypothetical protein